MECFDIFPSSPSRKEEIFFFIFGIFEPMIMIYSSLFKSFQCILNMSKILDIKLGYSCNNNCIHCVVANHRHLGDRKTGEIKNELERARLKCDHVCLTGGEPSIRPDIMEVMGYIRKLRFEKITIQTNGRLFSYDDFARRMVKMTGSAKAYYVVAVHSHKPEIHEEITNALGSFEQTINGIKKLVDLRQNVISQSVINKLNYRGLPRTMEFLIGLGVKSIQLPFVHPAGNAWKHFDSVVPRLSTISPYIHKAMDACGQRIDVETEGIPFCFMPGYEEHVSEQRRPRTVEMISLDEHHENFNHFERNYSKTPQCKRCRYDDECQGTWREYVERNGCEEFKAIGS
jgi:MoaA/NifB/PqqE/SkfB family radical SAM enzyme